MLFPTINNRIEENVNRSSDETIPMEYDQQASTILSSHIDDDIIEIEGLLKIFMTQSINEMEIVIIGSQNRVGMNKVRRNLIV